MTNTQNTTAVYTFDEDVVSDFHKDAYGFRPSQDWWIYWSSMSDAEKQAEWDSLGLAMDIRSRQAEIDEAWAINKFEKLVATTIEAGAKTREDALRWIMDASGCDGDWEYLCYHNGLPYHYFKKVA